MILDFNLMVRTDQPTALEERDRLIELLQSNGYYTIWTEDGRVLMEKETRSPKAPPCQCACNPPNIYVKKVACGGCGHAGCGWRG